MHAWWSDFNFWILYWKERIDSTKLSSDIHLSTSSYKIIKLKIKKILFDELKYFVVKYRYQLFSILLSCDQILLSLFFVYIFVPALDCRLLESRLSTLCSPVSPGFCIRAWHVTDNDHYLMNQWFLSFLLVIGILKRIRCFLMKC